MKTLVVYFSKTGNTKKIAEKIAGNLGADIDEIIDKEAKSDEKIMKKELVEIGFTKDPAEYDVVVIGGPVWGFSLNPMTKSYIVKNKFQNVAFFCTYGLWNGLIFGQMEKLTKEPKATLKVHAKNLENSDDQIKEFCDKVKV